MGYRTLVLLHNDLASEWIDNPQLGRMINHAMNFATDGRVGNPEARLEGFGSVVQCTHADTQTVAIIDSYQFKPIAFSTWRPGESAADRDIRLLKEAADKLGYRLVKKST